MRTPITLVLFLLRLMPILAVIPGCARGTPLERSGVAVTPPASWQQVRPTAWMVPGTALAAWSGPDGSSLVIYRTLWVPDGSAEMLLEGQANRLGNLPGAKLIVKRTETTAGGAPAARLELDCAGNGRRTGCEWARGAHQAFGQGTRADPAGHARVCPADRNDLLDLAHAGGSLRSDRAGYPGHTRGTTVQLECGDPVPQAMI